MSDEIPLIPVVPQDLREAAQRGMLIPFIGKSRVARRSHPMHGEGSRTLPGMLDLYKRLVASG